MHGQGKMETIIQYVYRVISKQPYTWIVDENPSLFISLNSKNNVESKVISS